MVAKVRPENQTAESQEWLHQTMRTMHDAAELVLLANNRYDQLDVEQRLGMTPRLIPSLCAYTGQTWTGTKPAISHSRRPIGLPTLPRGHTYAEVAERAACVVVPYNASQMSVSERYQMGMPLILPSRAWTEGRPDHLNELGSDAMVRRRPPTDAELSRYFEAADWFTTMSDVNFFDSLPEAIEMSCASELRRLQDPAERARSIEAQWVEVLNGFS